MSIVCRLHWLIYYFLWALPGSMTSSVVFSICIYNPLGNRNSSWRPRLLGNCFKLSLNLGELFCWVYLFSFESIKEETWSIWQLGQTAFGCYFWTLWLCITTFDSWTSSFCIIDALKLSFSSKSSSSSEKTASSIFFSNFY